MEASSGDSCDEVDAMFVVVKGRSCGEEMVDRDGGQHLLVSNDACIRNGLRGFLSLSPLASPSAPHHVRRNALNARTSRECLVSREMLPVRKSPLPPSSQRGHNSTLHNGGANTHGLLLTPHPLQNDLSLLSQLKRPPLRHFRLLCWSSSGLWPSP